MKILFTCGGTGGHIYPAIAIADKIKRKHPDVEILFVGTESGMEHVLVPAAGYAVERIAATGLDRRHLLRNVHTLRNMLRGSAQVRKILDRFQPDRVIGTGGYVTGPVIREAAKRGIPTYIHEQNAVPGVANRMLERYVRKVFISFPDSSRSFRHPRKLVLTGNPVRKEFILAGIKDCRADQGFLPTAFVILVFGGSLGAQVLNRETIRLIPHLNGTEAKLVFVTGKRYYDQVKAELDTASCQDNVMLLPYADHMPQLLHAADLVISRAGALALAEITVCGKPSLLVPSPNVTNDHQYHNAKALSDTGAAIVVKEEELESNESMLAYSVLKLMHNKEKLNAMSLAAVRLGKADAADIIYDNLELDTLRSE